MLCFVAVILQINKFGKETGQRERDYLISRDGENYWHASEWTAQKFNQ